VPKIQEKINSDYIILFCSGTRLSWGRQWYSYWWRIDEEGAQSEAPSSVERWRVVPAQALWHPSQKGNGGSEVLRKRVNLVRIVVESPLYRHKGECWVVWLLVGYCLVIASLLRGYDQMCRPEQIWIVIAQRLGMFVMEIFSLRTLLTILTLILVFWVIVSRSRHVLFENPVFRQLDRIALNLPKKSEEEKKSIRTHVEETSYGTPSLKIQNSII